MKTILVFGTQRSGHHAIINWIGMNADKGIDFFNDCQLKAFVNGRRVYQGKYKITSFRSEGQDRKVEIYNFENININQHPRILQSPLVHDHYKTIIPIRDVYNMVASSIKSTPQNTKSKIFKRVRRWMEQCKEVMGETTFVPEGKLLFINYNTWVKDRQYRDYMARAIGFENQDEAVNMVSDYGGGSSFQKNVEDASKLMLFERYKEYIDHPVFKAAITPEVEELNERIFGFNLKDLHNGRH